MLVMVTEPGPAFDSTDCFTALIVPTAWLPKSALAGFNESVPIAPVGANERWKTVVPPTPSKSEIMKK